MAQIDLMSIKPHVIDPSLNGKIFWFYGEPGTRKTSVAAKFPQSLIIATENGYKFINGVRAQNISNWNEMKQVYRQLKDKEVMQAYRTIVFDRADTLYEYCKTYICAIKGISDLGELAFSAGYRAAKNEFNSVIKGIESLGYGIIFITHDKIDMEKQTRQDMESSAAKVLKGYTDFIFLLKKEVVEERQTVVAYSQKVETDTKARLRYFVPSFEFTFENLQKELESAVQKQIQMEGIEVEIKERMIEEKRSLEEVRNSVIQLYSEFKESDHAKLPDIESVIMTQLPGIRISQTNESYYDKLLTIEAFMLDIE